MMKSLLTQVIWPSWEWGPRNQPFLRYVSASYSESLTIRDNRRARQLIESDMYQHLWGDRFAMASDQNAKVKYENDHRGFRIATSVGGTATGERGDRFIIDDPHNVKTAESEVDLDSKAQWFTEVVPSRVNDLDESAFVVIMQRVHERDVSGLILAEGLPYVHLELPMEFEPSRRCHTVLRPAGADPAQPEELTFTDPRTVEDELLFPERFTAKGVADLKRTLSSWGGDYAVAGQLQQRPAPRGGGMFKRDACGEPLEFAPANCEWVRGWDIAGSTRKTSPYTASVMLGKTPTGGYVVKHVTRVRAEIEAAEQHIVDTARDDDFGVHQDLPQDPGSAGKSQKAHLGKALDGRKFSITPESGDKADRAIPLASQWNNGNVKIVKGPWNDAFLNELATFPRGAYKDQVDAASRAYQRLISVPTTQVPEGPREVKAGSMPSEENQSALDRALGAFG
jgi:predicted phage terminase large subunit-like protein